MGLASACPQAAGWNGIFVKTGRLEMGARFALSSAESCQVSRSRCSLARLGGESVSVFKIANHIYGSWFSPPPTRDLAI